MDDVKDLVDKIRSGEVADAETLAAQIIRQKVDDQIDVVKGDVLRDPWGDGEESDDAE